MIQSIKDYLPWLLSAITIWMTLLAGNKHPRAWLIGLGNQFLWLIWIVSAASDVANTLRWSTSPTCFEVST